MKRIVARLAALIAFVTVMTPGPSHALNGDDGSCIFNVRMTVSGGLHSAASGLGSPSYSLTITPGTDLDILDGGNQNCYYPLGFLNPFRASAAGATPNTAGDIVTCDLFVGFGTFNQGWNPSPPDGVSFMSYTLVGTWGHWTMFINDPAVPPGFYAAIDLTFFNLGDNANYTFCNNPSGIGILNLAGEEVFQDP